MASQVEFQDRLLGGNPLSGYFMQYDKAYILLVDDNPDNLLSLEAILGDLNQTLIRANTGKEALKLVLKYDFAAILMDVHMPDMDGLETARLIRSRDRSQYTPIIFLSALYKDEDNIGQGYALGAVDYIFKPIDAAILRSKVQVFVDLHTKSTHAKALQIELEKRKKAEANLRLLNERVQLILASAGEGIYGLNSRGFITFANPAAAAILGMQVEELIKQPVSVMLPLEKSTSKSASWRSTPIYQALKNNATYHIYDTYFRQKDGKTIPVEYTVTPSQDKKVKDLSLVVVFKDISERKQAEHLAKLHERKLALAHEAKLSTMEEMASALAHELNQPLTVIANYTKGTVRRLKAGTIQQDELIEVLQLTAHQSERAGKIIHRIKNFVRKGKLFYESIAINKLIKAMVELMRPELETANISIEFQLANDLPSIEADRVQLEQVILNLLRNAMEAMQAPDIVERHLFITTLRQDDKTINICIKDTGIGLTLGVIDKLFEPYYTTKPMGMGMGLAICRSIIEAHGGSLEAVNNQDSGCSFNFTLPISVMEVLDYA